MLKSVKYLDAGTMLQSAHGDEAEHDEHHFPVGEMDGFEAKHDTDNTDVPAGQRIHMRLMQRPQMTTMALPASSTWPSEAIPPHTAPWFFLPDVLAFSRFSLATPDYMLKELQRELEELKTEWSMLQGDALGRDFVRAAREKVEKQVQKVKLELMTDLVKRSEEGARETWDDAIGGERRERERRKERERRARDQERQSDASTEASQSLRHDILPNRPVEPNPMPKRNRRKPGHPPTPSVPPSPSYYFYQSSLGANVFLHPLDIRILLAHFKSYSLFPNTISFASAGFDPGTINDELRKRCKYLSHLPAGTEVVFVEAELEEIVGKDGLLAFEQPLKARRAKRRERVKKEDRAKSRWEKAEREKLPPPTEDREFALALARSTVETNWADQPVLGVSAGSSHGAQTAPLPSPSTSPTGMAVWGSLPQPRATFATALHSHATTPTPARPREDDYELDAAWDAFEGMNIGTMRETEKGGGGGGGGGGRKGGKKTPKKTLVLGGGMGGRRA